jgi:hypothetical protein
MKLKEFDDTRVVKIAFDDSYDVMPRLRLAWYERGPVLAIVTTACR